MTNTTNIDQDEHYEHEYRLGYDDETGRHYCNVCDADAKATGQSFETGATLYRCANSGVSLGVSGL